ASGYAISERMRVQIRSLDQSNQNTQNDLSMMKTAEGAVSSTVEILKALKEKAINAANDSNTDSDRQTIQKEMDQFIDQIDDNALVTFNGKYLVDGSKNFRSENGTKTTFTNMALHTTTTAASALNTLRARNGDSLEIAQTDRVTASVVIDGRTYVTTFHVGVQNKGTNGATNLNDGNGTYNGDILTLNDIFVKLNKVTDDAGIGKVFGTANFTATTPHNESAKTTAPEENSTVGGTTNSYVDGPNSQQPTLVHAGAMVGKNAAGDAVRTSDGTTGFTVTATSIGYGFNSSTGKRAGQIAGFNISITDSQGNVKKAANAALDAFGMTIREMNRSEDNSLNFHVGANANQAIKVGLTDMRSEALGLKGSTGTKLKVTTKELANAAVNVIDNALTKAIDQQTDIGSVEARLEYTSSNLTTSSENVQNAESTIRDADMAKEMTNYTKNNVLLQAAQSMLAQANQNSSAVLSLLQ
ncbi:MAG: flagellin, partial [Selenomonadaceae bacterium]|nr:flagellin [Selenomonadaceae bacterium]